MEKEQAHQALTEIFSYYSSIKSPKIRYADPAVFRENFRRLQELKDTLSDNQVYIRLLNAMSQIVAKLDRMDTLINKPKDQTWSNLSERGMNKVIPPILKSKETHLPVEWIDRWGYTCSVSNGYWEAKNYRVMDALGYMFLMKIGGDCLPKKAEHLFNDLWEVEQRENQLNGGPAAMVPVGLKHYIKFTDKDFRKMTGMSVSATDITKLLLETSRVEFKLTFPVRLKSTGAKENTHHMHYYSRFFEFAYEDLKVKSNGVVMSSRYQIVFNTLLGELFVNNLLARYNDRVNESIYLLPDSAQIFYRRALLHHNYKTSRYSLESIAELTGLKDTNRTNLIKTVESGILQPLKDFRYIDSYTRIENSPGDIKYIIERDTENMVA